MKTIICALFLFFTFSASAQYPFEKYPAIKYNYASFKIIKGHQRTSNVAIATYKNYKVEILEERQKDSCNILLYSKNQLIKKSIVQVDIVLEKLGDLNIGDIDGNGFPDFRVQFTNEHAGGLGSSLVFNLYLFNAGQGQFNKIFFADFYRFDNKELAFNKDGKYEIVSGGYVSYKYHAYWVFDVYSYKAGKLINVGAKYGYPRVYDFFEEKETHKMTKRIVRNDMGKLSKRFPDFYEQDK